SPAPWMAIGFHVGLSGAADRPLSRYDEGFIPMRLREALREVRLEDGRPLVLAEETLAPHRLAPPPDEAPRLRGTALVAGLALAAGPGRLRPRLLAAGRPGRRADALPVDGHGAQLRLRQREPAAAQPALPGTAARRLGPAARARTRDLVPGAAGAGGGGCGAG